MIRSERPASIVGWRAPPSGLNEFGIAAFAERMSAWRFAVLVHSYCCPRRLRE
jgi:hypothetical protein